jgi:beta-glucosidase
VLHAIPADGTLRYDEGLLIGYRGFDRSGAEPLFPFGHGLGYTTWSLDSIQVDAGQTLVAGPTAGLELTLVTRNVGERQGRDLQQIYVSPPDGDPHRPVRALAAFAGVTAAPGETARLRVTVPARAFGRWDEAAGGWVYPPGDYRIEVGRSSRDLPVSLVVTRT